jgi:hypothetical protein
MTLILTPAIVEVIAVAVASMILGVGYVVLRIAERIAQHYFGGS